LKKVTRNGFCPQANRIILATDADKAGQALAEELARRLGRERSYFLLTPFLVCFCSFFSPFVKIIWAGASFYFIVMITLIYVSRCWRVTWPRRSETTKELCKDANEVCSSIQSVLFTLLYDLQKI
jgi:hypothetical protein